MDYREKLRNELVEVRDKYYAAKNEYNAAKAGLKPDYIKEDVKLLWRTKKALGYYLSCMESKCKLYDVDIK